MRLRNFCGSESCTVLLCRALWATDFPVIFNYNNRLRYTSLTTNQGVGGSKSFRAHQSLGAVLLTSMIEDKCMQLILVDPKPELITQFDRYFTGLPNVETVVGRFEDLPQFDCMVSAANSFGLMDGGVDRSLNTSVGICRTVYRLESSPNTVESNRLVLQ